MADDIPKISFIVPAYNVEKYVAECIDSILLQSIDKEIIIVNDGSTDRTGSILREYASNHDCIQLLEQANQGLAAARNRGLSIAKGEYVCFIDSDDYFTCDFAMDFYSICREQNLDICIGNFLGMDEDGHEYDVVKPSDLAGQRIPIKRFFSHSILYDRSFQTSVWNKLFRRSLLESLGCGFPEGIYWEDIVFDFQLFLRAPASCNVMQLDRKTYAYRFNNQSITRKHVMGKHFLDYMAVLNLLNDEIVHFGDPDTEKAAYLMLESTAVAAMGKFFSLSCADRRKVRRHIVRKPFWVSVAHGRGAGQRILILLFICSPMLAGLMYDLISHSISDDALKRMKERTRI